MQIDGAAEFQYKDDSRFTVIVAGATSEEESLRLLTEATDTKTDSWSRGDGGFSSLCDSLCTSDVVKPVVFGIDNAEGHFVDVSQVKSVVHGETKWPGRGACKFSANPTRACIVEAGERYAVYVTLPDGELSDQDIANFIVEDLGIAGRGKRKLLDILEGVIIRDTRGVPPQFDDLRKTPGVLFAWSDDAMNYLTSDEFIDRFSSSVAEEDDATDAEGDDTE